MRRGNIDPSRHITYGGIELIPHDEHTWHVPGGGVKTTKELVKLGTERGVAVHLVEVTNEGRKTEILN